MVDHTVILSILPKVFKRRIAKIFNNDGNIEAKTNQYNGNGGHTNKQGLTCTFQHCVCFYVKRKWFFGPDELYPESCHFSLLIWGRELETVIFPLLLSVKTDCFHQLLYSKFFSSDLCLVKSHPGSRKKGFEFSAICRKAGVRSESQCFAREFPSPQAVSIQVGQNHPYTTHICFLFGCIVPLCKFSIFFFLIPLPISREWTRTFFFQKRSWVKSVCYLEPRGWRRSRALAIL